MQDRFKSSGDELIAAIYQASAEIIPASRPLELLAELTRSDKVFTAWFNHERRQGGITTSFNVEPHFIESYRDYAPDNPWLARASYFQAEGLVWRGSDIVEPERLRSTDFHRLFMSGQGMNKTAHLVVRVRGPNLIHVMLSRPVQVEDYDDAAFDICRLYAVHARRALEIGTTADRWRSIELGLSEAMNELSAGVAVIEPPATVRYMNRTCDVLLNGRSASNGAAAFVNGKAPVSRRLPRPLIEALNARPVPRSLVILPPVDEGKRPIFVNIRPYQHQSRDDGLVHPGYVIVCRTADSEIEVDESALKAAYFLTTAEARVAAALVAGENVLAVAARLGISPETVRTHIKHILEKTYTTRQAELMKLLMSVSQRKTPPPAAPAEQPDVIAELMKAIGRAPGAEFNS